MDLLVTSTVFGLAGEPIVSDIKRYDGTTGAFIDTFASVGLGFAGDLVFGPDGNLYVLGGGE